MGVHGLWNLLEPAGKVVPLESLENKVLAVDVSIWLHQLVKGFQDSRGNSLPNAHLLGLFHRICKLLFFKIKPVFVFDGDVPLLKKQTVAARQRQRGKLEDDATQVRQKLAKNILKHAAIKEALGPEKADQQVQLNMARGRQEPDIFELPPLKPSEPSQDSEIDYMSSSEGEVDDDEAGASSAHLHADLHSIDVNCEDFKALPADVRHDILTELKETRKQNSWGNLHEMPEDSGQFSNFQMNRLLKRRNFQVSLEEAEKEMGGRTLTLGELEEVLNDNGVMTDTSLNLGKRIASDSTTRFVYIREAAKKTLFPSASNKTKSKDVLDSKILPESTSKLTCQAGASKEEISSEEIIIEEEDKFEDDWVSDPESETNVAANTGSTVQKSVKSRVDLARDFMFVASDLTQDQIDKILIKRRTSPQKRSQPSAEFNSLVSDLPTPGTSAHCMEGTQPGDDLDYIGIISDESESDSERIGHQIKDNAKPIEIVVKPDKKYEIEEDMFADIFFNIEHAMLNKQKQIVESLQLTKNQQSDSTNLVEQQQDISKQLAEKNESPNKCMFIEVIVKNAEVKDQEQNDIVKNKNVTGKQQIISEVGKQTNVPISIAHYNYDEKALEKTKIQTQPLSDAGHLLDSHKPFKEMYKISDKTCIGFDSSVTNDFENSDQENYILCQKNSENQPPTKSSKPNSIEKKSDIELEIHPAIIGTPPIMSKEAENNLKGKPSFEVDSSEERHGMGIVESSLSKETGESLEDGTNDVSEMPCALASTIKISTVQLQGIQAILENQHKDLMLEKGKTERMAASITSQMCTEAQELLRLFGLPYLVAPMEAEAQCAFLDSISLTDGTISDDSDIWLFGGRKVYKNFFNQKKHVMQFTSGDIHQVLKLARNQMILLALLTGSDYTTGLSGVGPVTALEILAAFPSGSVDDERYMARDLSFGLKKFREWFSNGRPVGPGTATLRNKLKDLELSDGFPSLAVLEGYLKPTIDDSKEKFTWGKPDVIRLQEYTRLKFGWTKMKTDEILTPVVNKLNEKHKQMSLDAYIHVKLPSVDGKLSKRVQKAVHRLGTETTNSDTEDDPQPVVKKPKKISANDPTPVHKSIKNKRSKGNDVSGEKVRRLDVAPSTSSEYIPQREKDRLNALQKKMKAIEVFRTCHLEGKKLSKGKRPLRIEKADAELSESDSD